MNYFYIGKLVNTHGIKGEVRILSSFKNKELIFKEGFKLYIGKDKLEYEIESYRKHKNFDMVVFKNNYDINLILHLKGSYVYINKDDIKDNSLAINLIDYKVICNNEVIGIVKDVIYNNASEILLLDNDKMIPYVKDFIKKIDNGSKNIEINYVKGLLD